MNISENQKIFTYDYENPFDGLEGLNRIRESLENKCPVCNHDIIPSAYGHFIIPIDETSFETVVDENDINIKTLRGEYCSSFRHSIVFPIEEYTTNNPCDRNINYCLRCTNEQCNLIIKYDDFFESDGEIKFRIHEWNQRLISIDEYKNRANIVLNSKTNKNKVDMSIDLSY